MNQSSSIISNQAICQIYDVNINQYRKYRVLITITYEYLATFLNWFIFYKEICSNTLMNQNDRLNQENLYIICLDPRIDQYLSLYQLKCSAIRSNIRGKEYKMWMFRTQITLKLLVKGYDVLLTDNDALWLKNPLPIIEKYLDNDIISSR